MRKLFFTGLLGLGMLSAAWAQQTYQYSIDLNQVENDQLKVTLKTPAVSDSTVEFHLPKIVPGTYSISDFGRFASDFKAYDTQGNELPVEKLTDNRWKISEATGLAQISYTLDDTYDTDLGNVIFEPSGTNFEASKNFVLNTHGIFGYLQGHKDQPFEISVTRPENFFGGTALEHKGTQGNTDTFTAPRYFELADSPIMYCEPDTATVMVGGAEVLVSVYSPNKKLTAAFVKQEVSEILEAQEAYLGGKLPVDRYAFLIYLFDGESLSGAYGALEHSYSSMYFLPEAEPSAIASTIRDVSSHEFFHIVTPLNIHSEEIGNFNFIDPKMSQHLWLYEGVTEYSAHHAQLSYGLTELEDFLTEFRNKIVTSRSAYDDALPFTQMSKGVLDQYEDEYGNVYQKGALIGLCLDVKLRQWSNGEYGIQALMRDLSKTYGKEVSFKDTQLFDKIAELTAPEIKTFLTTYVSGDKQLPLEETFAALGITYTPEKEGEVVRMSVALNYNPETSRIFVQSTAEASEFAQSLGFEDGDELVSIKGVELTINNYQTVFQDLAETPAGEKVKIVVARKQEDGTYKNKKLKARAITSSVTLMHVLEPMETLTPEQEALRAAWLGN